MGIFMQKFNQLVQQAKNRRKLITGTMHGNKILLVLVSAVTSLYLGF
jgi:hypothetical protein